MSKLLDIFSKESLKKDKSIFKSKILIDYRERNSLVPAELLNLGFQLEYRQLPISDYIINNTAIERKTLSDFKSSIIDKRITHQLLEIKKFPKSFLILEGLEKNPYSGNFHENAFRGFILTIILKYNIPIIFSLNEKDTAKYISVLARKKPLKELPIRASKNLLSNKEQIQFILEGFPQIGPINSKKLIKKFKTIKNISNAPEKKLKEVIGKKSKNLFELFNYK